MPTLLLPGNVQTAPAGLTGVDVDTPLAASDAINLKNAGYSFCIRYIPRTAALIEGNLTNSEALGILNACLALMPVQHVSLPGWNPNTNLGTIYGNYAAIYTSQVVKLPQGVNVWSDLEGVAAGTSPNDEIAYCQAWYYAVHIAGYIPGIYVGYDTMLSPEQLYDDISFQHYWRAYNGPDVPTRGFQLIQKTEVTLNGITFDPNVTQNDEMGDAALWLSL
jgi:hypothetical protein